jgi:acyl-CoA synthetase (AMP-forming)/AMP-acid ligase II
MDRVLRLCGAMRELGLKKDDRFAVMALNSHQFLELYHAAFLGSGVINPLNLRLALPELEYILKDSGYEELQHALRQVFEGRPYLSPRISGESATTIFQDPQQF